VKVTWLEKENFVTTVIGQLKDAEVVLDIGCGIMPQSYITPKMHICCEPFEQYVEVLLERLKGESDRNYIVLNATWSEAIKIFPAKSVDTVFLVDVVEHLEKEEGLRLLKATERIVKKQIVVFTPFGFIRQEHPTGRDAWNLEGGVWQKHRSGWLPEDFDDNWKIYACKDYHTTDNMGNPFDKPLGAFWSIWEYPSMANSQEQRYSDAPKSLWLDFQALQKKHQALQQTKAVIFARKLEENPFLMKLASVGYCFMAKIYLVLRRRKTEQEFTQIKLASDVQNSVTKRESTRDWWESCHKKDHKFWLSGTNPQKIWESLKIAHLIIPGTIVLNIGVGLGYDTFELAKHGCIIDALDISETALARVMIVVSRIWLTSQIQDLPPNTYDLVISHLVAQHMSNQDLSEQITHVIRSLKSSGVFAIQFAYPLNGKIDILNEDELHIKSGAVVRTMDMFKEMVLKAGGRIAWSQELERFPDYGLGWYGVQIQRVE